MRNLICRVYNYYTNFFYIHLFTTTKNFKPHFGFFYSNWFTPNFCSSHHFFVFWHQIFVFVNPLFYTKFLLFLHQNFALLKPKFCSFYNKFLLFYTKYVLFTPIFYTKILNSSNIFNRKHFCFILWFFLRDQ